MWEDGELKSFLDDKVREYNTGAFIDEDPVLIPHQFVRKEDQEISAFLAATISWGSRKTIVRNARRMIALMGDSPYDFVMNHREHQLHRLDGFIHRTFNGEDLRYFVRALRRIYIEFGGMEQVFQLHAESDSLQGAIHGFKQHFFAMDHPARTRKHVSDPLAGSSAKRINMFLRWMVRRDSCGVDLGLWRTLSPSQLSCPLDVHTGKVARRLGLLERRQHDARAVQELDSRLRAMDREDPVKYDFALFGLGIFENF